MALDAEPARLFGVHAIRVAAASADDDDGDALLLQCAFLEEPDEDEASNALLDHSEGGSGQLADDATLRVALVCVQEAPAAVLRAADPPRGAPQPAPRRRRRLHPQPGPGQVHLDALLAAVRVHAPVLRVQRRPPLRGERARGQAHDEPQGPARRVSPRAGRLPVCAPGRARGVPLNTARACSIYEYRMDAAAYSMLQARSRGS